MYIMHFREELLCIQEFKCTFYNYNYYIDSMIFLKIEEAHPP